MESFVPDKKDVEATLFKNLLFTTWNRSNLVSTIESEKLKVVFPNFAKSEKCNFVISNFAK